jgi:acetyl-CoA C-acetyltransferase
MPKTVVLSSARTPIGKMGGALASLPAVDLGARAIEAALERAAVEPDQVQHVIMGQVLQAGVGQIPSRQAQIKAGIPKDVSSETINKVCASGVRATVLLDLAIRAATSRSAWPGAWSRCPTRRGCCRVPASAFAWATSRRWTRWSPTA